ncbi:hypothetical protein RRG08_039183 [Elysia crispata]|uniref:Uncharacterized protein n=1 Tax=Elysia crispata TaxID=231223 RepID=A0AAE0ZFE3_9GAST|nr:hypothetical protein RRG08_039183 [Elysia crispata]
MDHDPMFEVDTRIMIQRIELPHEALSPRFFLPTDVGWGGTSEVPTAPETQQVVIVLTKIGGSPSLKCNQVEPNVNSGCNPRHLWRSSEPQITIDGHIVNTDRGHVYPGCSFVPQSGAGSCGDRIILTDGKGGRTVRSLICRHLCGIPKHPALSFLLSRGRVPPL